MYAILTAAVAALMLGTTGGMNAATAVPAAVHASGTEQKQEPAPELSFDRMEHDFGTLRFKGEPQTAGFRLYEHRFGPARHHPHRTELHLPLGKVSAQTPHAGRVEHF